MEQLYVKIRRGKNHDDSKIWTTKIWTMLKSRHPDFARLDFSAAERAFACPLCCTFFIIFKTYENSIQVNVLR